MTKKTAVGDGPVSLARFLAVQLLLCWLLLPHAYLAAQAQAQALALDEAVGSYSLAGAGEWRVDPDPSATPPQMARAGGFQPVASDTLNLGFVKDAAAWVRVRLRNPGPSPAAWRLWVEDGRIDAADAWLLPDGGAVQALGHSGRFTPYGQRPVVALAYAFDLELPPGKEAVLVLRLAGWQIMAPGLRLQTAKAQLARDKTDGIWLGLVFGAFLMAAVHNLLLFVTVREKAYWYLALFILAFAVNRAAQEGLTGWLFPDSRPMATELSRGLLYVMGLAYAALFLEIKTRQPRLYPLWIVCMGLSAIPSPLALAIPPLNPFSIWMGNLSALLVLYAALRAMLSGFRPARLFLLGWLAVMLANAHATLQALGWFQGAVASWRILLYAGVVTAALFTLSLGERITNQRRDFQLADALRRRREADLREARQERGAALAAWRDALDGLASAEDRERRSLARRLHDGPLQRLALANVRLDWLGHDIGQPADALGREDPAAHVRSLRELLLCAIREFRFLLFDLAPASLEEQGLAAALADLARQAEASGGLRFRYLGPAAFDLDSPAQRATLYRCAAELAVNAIKHARAAREAEIRLRVEDGAVELAVWNDGEPPPSPLKEGFGLDSLRQDLRPLGGELRLEPVETGFLAVARLPLELRPPSGNHDAKNAIL